MSLNKGKIKVKSSQTKQSNPYSKDMIYDPRGQWAHPGQNTRIPGGDITMQGVNYPVMGVDNNGRSIIMMPGGEYNFPGADYVDEFPMYQDGGVKQRSTTFVPYREGDIVLDPENDNRPSTHLMAREYIPGEGWVAFPTLFQNGKDDWKEIQDVGEAYAEAKKRGEVNYFGEDVKAAISFADDGDWKQEKKYGGLIKYQNGGGKPKLPSREGWVGRPQEPIAHGMMKEYIPGKGWVVFPTLFQDEDDNWSEIREPIDAYDEALKRKEVQYFEKEEDANNYYQSSLDIPVETRRAMFYDNTSPFLYNIPPHIKYGTEAFEDYMTERDAAREAIPFTDEFRNYQLNLEYPEVKNEQGNMTQKALNSLKKDHLKPKNEKEALKLIADRVYSNPLENDDYYDYMKNYANYENLDALDEANEYKINNYGGYRGMGPTSPTRPMTEEEMVQYDKGKYQDGGAAGREVTPEQYYQFLVDTRGNKPKVLNYRSSVGVVNPEQVGENNANIYNFTNSKPVIKGEYGVGQDRFSFDSDDYSGGLDSEYGEGYRVVSVPVSQMSDPKYADYTKQMQSNKFGKYDDNLKNFNKFFKKKMQDGGGNTNPYIPYENINYNSQNKYEGPGPMEFYNKPGATPEEIKMQNFYDNYYPEGFNADQGMSQTQDSYKIRSFEVPMPDFKKSIPDFKIDTSNMDRRMFNQMQSIDLSSPEYIEQLRREGKSDEEIMSMMQDGEGSLHKAQAGEQVPGVYGEDPNVYQQEGLNILASNLNAPFVNQPGYYDYADKFSGKRDYDKIMDARAFATYRKNPYEEGTRDFRQQDRENIKNIRDVYMQSKDHYKQVKRGNARPIAMFDEGGSYDAYPAEQFSQMDPSMLMQYANLSKKDFKVEPNYVPQEENKDYTKNKKTNFAELLRNNVINSKLEEMYSGLKELKKPQMFQTGGAYVGVGGQGISRDIYASDMSILKQQLESGQITREEYDAQLNNVNDLYDGKGDWQNYQGLNNNNGFNNNNANNPNGLQEDYRQTMNVPMLDDPLAPEPLDYGDPLGVDYSMSQDPLKMQQIPAGTIANTPNIANTPSIGSSINPDGLTKMTPKSAGVIENSPGTLTDAGVDKPLGSSLPPQMGAKKPKNNAWIGQAGASGALAGLSMLNGFLESRARAERERELSKDRMADSVFTTKPSMSGDRGDYEMNTGLFRPDDKTYAQNRNYNRYQNGGAIEEWFAQGDKIDAARNAHAQENTRVQNVRNAIPEEAYKIAAMNNPRQSLPPATANWVGQNGFACNTYACQVMQNAGATVPSDSPDMTFGSVKVGAGDPLPIVTGNGSFNSQAKNLGFDLLPAGTIPESGDLIRGHYNNTSGRSGSYHAVIAGEDGSVSYSPGGVDEFNMYSGNSNNPWVDPSRYAKGSDNRVMRYVGDVPRLENEFDQAQQRFQQMDAPHMQKRGTGQVAANLEPHRLVNNEERWMRNLIVEQDKIEAMDIEDKKKAKLHQKLQKEYSAKLDQMDDPSLAMNKFGGTSVNYQEGGEYEMSDEDIQYILANGGTIEYLD